METVVKTLVYGAGPLGSLYAARLYQAGVDVSILARGQRLADLREYGVILEGSHSGQIKTYRVPVVEQLRQDDPYDLILVVMRKDMALDILPILASNRHAHTILFLQNNPSGFQEYIEALGAQRVMVGFPTSGGWRKDPVMCVMPLDWLYIPIGEVDGQVTARTLAVASVLRRMGKKVQVRRDMDAWLVTHIPAIVVFLGVYAADLDAQRFARTRDAIVMGVRARAESFRAQKAAGIPIRPCVFKLLPRVPEPMAVAIVRSMAGARFFEVGVLGHARVARDEMVQILEQYRERIASGGVPTPTLDLMIEHVKGARPLLPDGSRKTPMSWKGVCISALAMLSCVGVLLYGRRH